MFIAYSDASVRTTGRWHDGGEYTTCTACGSYLELAFEGSSARLHFDIDWCRDPRPHLWLDIDGGVRTECELSPFIRVDAGSGGRHTLTVILKSAVEIQHRWYMPLEGKLTFIGYEADAPAALAPDTRPVIEFVGDSITEGVLIDAELEPYYREQTNRPWQDDACATYAWLTAETLNARPVICGYGYQGIINTGNASVPGALTAYPYCYDGAPAKYGHPDLVVINHGTNDREYPERVEQAYYDFLCLVRSCHPNTRIAALSPFLGCFGREISGAVERFSKEDSLGAEYISTQGWLPPEPLHPTRAGHAAAAARLVPILKEKFGL